ncbi:MAG: hypothetical protein ACM3X1_08980, partial [Ignavibacteriales bacterium]
GSEDDGGGSEDDGGGSEDDGGGSEDDGGGSEDDDTEVDEEDKLADVMIEADDAQERDNTIAQDPQSFDSTLAARLGDRGALDTAVNTVVPVPQIDPGVPVPQIDTESPQLVAGSETISNMKKEVKKTEEILSVEDEKFVDGIINYAKERVEKDNDIDEESKLLLTKLTTDETKALVSAQIQFIEYGLPDMQTGTTVPSGKVGDNEYPQSMGTESFITKQLSLPPTSGAPVSELDNNCHYDPSVPKCTSEGSKCSDEYGIKDDGQCLPTRDNCLIGANSNEDDKNGGCLQDMEPCKKWHTMNDNKNCAKKSFCEKHPNDNKCKYKNDNKNGNGKDSDDNNSHDGGGARGDEIVIQSAIANANVNATVAVNTLNGTYVCSREGITAATQQAFDLLKYQTCGTQLNGQKAYYDGFVQQCMQRNSKEICKAATGLSSNMEKQLLQPLQAPQTMQQQAPQTMQQYVQQESQHQATTQQIMEILNNVPEAQRQGILSKVDQSELPKLIHASFPLAMTVVDVAPGSKVVKEITERPELHAMLNPHEKQVFLSLNTHPTPEKLAEFLDLPPEKLPEFLNMLTKDELSEMFDMLPQDTLTSVLTYLNTNERNEPEHGGRPISSI